MKRKIIILTAIVIFAAVLFCVYWFYNRDRREVESLIREFVEFTCVASGRQPHEGALKYAKVEKFFAPKISLRVIDPDVKVDCNREEVKNMWGIYQRMVDRMDVKIEKVSVELNGDQASFFGDIKVDGVVKGGKIDFNGVYLLQGIAEKTDGQWGISSLIVEPVVK